MNNAKVPYKNKISELPISTFNGINLRSVAADSQYIDGYNLSGEQYPAICSSDYAEKVSELTDVQSLFAWDELITISAGNVYYGDKFLGSVSAGKKQLAVIGTKLVVAPDMVMFDFRTNEKIEMNYSYSDFQSTTVFTANSIKLPPIESGGEVESPSMAFRGSSTPIIRMYTGAVYNENTGWTWSRVDEVEMSIFASNMDTQAKFDTFINNRVALLSSNGAGFFIDGSFEELSNKDWAPIANTPYFCKIGFYESQEYGRSVPGDVKAIALDTRTKVGGQSFKYGSANIELSDLFEIGQAVTVSISDIADNLVEKRRITDIDDEQNKLIFADGTFTAGNSNQIELKREVPTLDFICESSNRLWGVSNRTENKIYNSETDEYDTVYTRTIHSSSLGKPLNFWEFAGLSTDSYAVAVASKGDFTAMVEYNNAIIFFKEDKIYRLTGDYPANYYMYSDLVEGVEKDSETSIAVIANVLYYKGKQGIYAYTGGKPMLQSYALGDGRFTVKAAAGIGNKYMAAVQHNEGVNEADLYELYIDAAIWNKYKDAGGITALCTFDGDLHYGTADGVYKVTKTPPPGSDAVEWEIKMAAWHENTFIKKQYRSLQIDIELKTQGHFEVYIRFDDDGEGDEKLVHEELLTGRKLLKINLPATRADFMQLRIVGYGDMIIRSLEKDFIVLSEELPRGG